MNNTGIGYLTHTWNPTKGCEPVSAGCQNCWANDMATRLAAIGVNGYEIDEPFKVRAYPDRIDEPLRAKKPKRIGVSFMGDLFHDDVPDAFIRRVFNVMLLAHWHEFVLLTKRPDRARKVISEMFEMMAWGRNNFNHIRFGVSVDGKASAKKVLEPLSGIPLNNKWISLEPMIGPVNFNNLNYMNEIGLIVVGGESGRNARPMPQRWARDVRDYCKEHNISFYMKQMSKRGAIPEDLQIREWPNA